MISTVRSLKTNSPIIYHHSPSWAHSNIRPDGRIVWSDVTSYRSLVFPTLHQSSTPLTYIHYLDVVHVAATHWRRFNMEKKARISSSCGNQTCISVGPDLYRPAQLSSATDLLSQPRLPDRKTDIERQRETFSLYEC